MEVKFVVLISLRSVFMTRFVVQEWANEEAEAEMDMVNAVAKATRTLRMAYELQPKLRYVGSRPRITFTNSKVCIVFGKSLNSEHRVELVQFQRGIMVIGGPQKNM